LRPRLFLGTARCWRPKRVYDPQRRDRSGLDDHRQRVYDPQSGRFTQEDPIGLAGGLNLYGFANSDPVNFSDPFGLCADDVHGGAVDSTKKTVTANFCSATGTLTLRDLTGVLVFETAAGNNTVNPAGDPNRVGSNGPAPSGVFPVQRPVLIPTEDVRATKAYGPAFFPIGQAGDIARRRGIGIHGGRRGPQSPTQGCIRVSDDALRQMVAQFNIVSITIGCP
jgi:RHS repeat-associated protein